MNYKELLEFMFQEEVKKVLVDMTVSDDLPMDMTTLDISKVFSTAKEVTQNNPHYIRVSKLDKLSEFFSGDSYEEMPKVLDALENEEDKSKMVDFLVEDVHVCETYEHTFTVESLLEAIS